MSAHTQGPWRAGRGCVVADHPVPEMGGSDAVDYYGGHLIAESIAPQNIPLISTAPEMLALLQELVDIEGAQPGNQVWAEKVLAAIAKATGVAK